ncbi:MAG: glycosyltransferase, partial [Spirochaetales bacterium]|nr:glycosyltransferase [Spirochaetales bacterium]
HDIFRIHHGTKKEAEIFTRFINDESVSLITISNYTKNDIIKTTGCTKNIPVIPNSIKFDISSQTKIPELTQKKYILDLNAYVSKKNPMTLLKAYCMIKDKTDLELVFCGGYKEESIWNEMHQYIETNSLSNRVKMLFRVTDEERNWLLTNAALFVTPSLFEGFGRTPVEAAICRIPVISTKETSLFEATQGLCSYVENSADEKELASLLLEKINSPDSSEKLVQISEQLSETYKAENCAEKYVQVFMLTLLYSRP